MKLEALPNLVCRNYYHYLVNRRRRRLTTNHAQSKHLSVIVILDSICILLIFINSFTLSHAAQSSTNPPTDDPFKSSSSLASTQCVIGRLRQCFEDEDCVENVGPRAPEVKVEITNKKTFTTDVIHSATIASKSADSVNKERLGICTCRIARRCKRNQLTPKIVPIGEKGRLADQRSKQSGHLGWIIGTLVALSLAGGCAFAIYYYGIRYGMIRNIARQLGFTDNTQVEHQLLNRISSNADDEVELAI